MTILCKNCGSQNHLSHDCSKPYSGWKEREPVAEPKPLSVAPKLEPEDSSKRKSGTENSFMKRRGFPFLRESTRRAIDDRIAFMTAPKAAVEARKPLPEIERDYKPPTLPKAAKATTAKAKTVTQKPINSKQESLF